VITQSMLSRVSDSPDGIDLDELRERMADLEHNTRDLQESVMQVRMLPLSSAFSRIPRLVRDLSRKLNKEVDLQMVGGSTELDKTVLERMIDPLVHLVRNGLDHGIETPEERQAAGKTGAGILHLSARQESGSVVIEIRDDGKGINCPFILSKAREKGIVGPDEELNDDQINQLIFAPGFSTAAVLSDVSGRGVGMDVVRRNIMDLGGRVHVYSTFGVGTRIEINLPLSLAILDGQLVRVAGEVYIIPILSIIETLELAQTERADVPGTGEVCRFRGEYLHMLRVADHFQLKQPSTGGLVVVIDTHGKRIGLVIDEVLGQQQVVIKPLDRNYKSVKGLAGATIMSDGSVALILDPANISEPESESEPLAEAA
jgi:two-component system chemotaxis sensor kinase CheA